MKVSIPHVREGNKISLKAMIVRILLFKQFILKNKEFIYEMNIDYKLSLYYYN
jgi:hypothetical protein